jgi:cytosine/adenosine deaminase-related metal-dependent hydrolase
MVLTVLHMKYVQGEILTTDGFTSGYLNVEQYDGTFEIQKGIPPEKPVATGLIVPSFVNAHTHIGDSFIRKKHLELPRNVKDLVGPPDGLKYQFLKSATEEEILGGIQTSLAEMDAAGTSWFCDFREGGLIGIFQLRKAMKDTRVDAVILSRPSHMTYNKEELDELLNSSNGIGLSSISDWEPTEIEKIAQHVRRKKKLFALHGSEVNRENIDVLLDLHPSFLVHMIAASQEDLERVKDADVPIVVCPRSYVFFYLKAHFEMMKNTGVTMLLGTDNAMINSPDVGEDVRLLRHTGLFSDEELLTNVTYTPRKALNLDDGIQGRDLLKHFIVLERESLKPIYVSQ